MHIERNKNITPNAKKLRREMTKQERKLWYEFLRHHEFKWYKQRVIGSYIADFYCAKALLVVEIDGSQHYTEDGIEYDQIREQYINANNIKVIRFSNVDVDNNFDGVCYEIDLEVSKRCKMHYF